VTYENLQPDGVTIAPSRHLVLAALGGLHVVHRICRPLVGKNSRLHCGHFFFLRGSTLLILAVPYEGLQCTLNAYKERLQRGGISWYLPFVRDPATPLIGLRSVAHVSRATPQPKRVPVLICTSWEDHMSNHSYDDPDLDALQFLEAVMHSPEADITDRIAAASHLLGFELSKPKVSPTVRPWYNVTRTGECVPGNEDVIVTIRIEGLGPTSISQDPEPRRIDKQDPTFIN